MEAWLNILCDDNGTSFGYEEVRGFEMLKSDILLPFRDERLSNDFPSVEWEYISGVLVYIS